VTTGPAPAPPAPAKRARDRILAPAAALLMGGYACYFVLPGLAGIFNDDDAMNLFRYWSWGPGALFRGLLFFFSSYLRPMGGVYFLTLYELFGLDPLPYHVVLVVLLLLNTYLSYRGATLLSGSKTAGYLCAILTSYHPAMGQMTYLPAFVFDVLCFTFYIAALAHYFRIRNTGALLTKRQLAAFLLLYVGALESKEMAAALPFAVLTYELIWHRPEVLSPSSARRWLAGAGRPLVIAGLMTVAYVVGKTTGPDALTNAAAFKPSFTWSLFLASNRSFANELLGAGNRSLLGPFVLLALALLAFVSWRRGDKVLLWGILFIGLSPLPIVFIFERGGPCLYIPLFGWALVVGTLMARACEVVGSHALRRVMSPEKSIPILVGLSVVAIGLGTDRWNREMTPGYRTAGRRHWAVLNQLKAVLPAVAPESNVVVLDDPLGGDTTLIALVLYHDHSVDVRAGSRDDRGDLLLAADYVLAFTGDDLRLVRSKDGARAPGPPAR
jgi:hypothetical protein